MEKLTRKEQATNSKRKISQYALQLFTEKGYDHVTVQDIATEAQMSIGAFYHHFDSKESVLTDAYHQFDIEFQAKWDAYHNTDNMKALLFLVEQLFCIQETGVALATQYFKERLTNENVSILNHKRFFYQQVCELVEALRGEHIFTEEATAIAYDISTTSRGVIYDWCLQGGNYDLVKQGMKIVGMVIQFYSTEKLVR
ncbi:MAG: TetR/AcrR family transcriptional regulator [Eubacteriales bacterium]